MYRKIGITLKYKAIIPKETEKNKTNIWKNKKCNEIYETVSLAVKRIKEKYTKNMLYSWKDMILLCGKYTKKSKSRK